MILQSTLVAPPTHNPLSSTLSFPSGSRFLFPFVTSNFSSLSIKCLSISRAYYNNGTLDYERKPVMKWHHVYKRISMMENPDLGVSSVLNECEKQGKVFTKWELSRIVRELRKYKRFNLALEVYEWMSKRIERFNLFSSDTAIQLDLIAKVHGVSSAEDYFMRIPDRMKDNRIYGALLNAYAGARVRDKAEFLMEQMRNKGYANHPLPFNVMMTLYMKLNEYDKVEKLISEMKQKSILLDMYSYNIWLSVCGSHGSVEDMEQIYEQMKSDPTISPTWTTFSTMAACYMKFGLLEKAEQYLKNLETRITSRDRMPYHYLISLYGNLGNKDEVYRVWNIYKSIFPSISNWGYHAVISSLIRLGDIEGAEKFYEEWLQVKASYDPRIGNLLMSWYVKEEPFEKVKGFFDHIVEVGGKPSSASWEILGEGHIKEGKISEALSCFNEAVKIDDTKNWKPKPSNVCAFMELCEKETDPDSKESFVGLLNQLGCFQDKTYMSLLVGVSGIEVGNREEQRMSDSVNETDDTESEESDILLSFAE